MNATVVMAAARHNLTINDLQVTPGVDGHLGRARYEVGAGSEFKSLCKFVNDLRAAGFSCRVVSVEEKAEVDSPWSPA